MSNTHLQLISDEDRLSFILEIEKRKGFGDRASLEEQTLHWDVDGASYTPVAATQDIKIQPLGLAAAATDASTETRRSQDPKIDGAGKLPGSMAILVCALGIEVQLNVPTDPIAITDALPLVVTAAALDELHAIEEMMENSVLRVGNGSITRVTLTGGVCCTYRTSRALAAVYNAAGAPFYSGAVSSKDRGFLRVKPFEIGTSQQLDMNHYLNRATALPSTAFRVRYWAHTLIARAH